MQILAPTPVSVYDSTVVTIQHFYDVGNSWPATREDLQHQALAIYLLIWPSNQGDSEAIPIYEWRPGQGGVPFSNPHMFRAGPAGSPAIRMRLALALLPMNRAPDVLDDFRRSAGPTVSGASALLPSSRIDSLRLRPTQHWDGRLRRDNPQDSVSIIGVLIAPRRALTPEIRDSLAQACASIVDLGPCLTDQEHAQGFSLIELQVSSVDRIQIDAPVLNELSCAALSLDSVQVANERLQGLRSVMPERQYSESDTVLQLARLAAWALHAADTTARIDSMLEFTRAALRTEGARTTWFTQKRDQLETCARNSTRPLLGGAFLPALNVLLVQEENGDAVPNDRHERDDVVELLIRALVGHEQDGSAFATEVRGEVNKLEDVVDRVVQRDGAILNAFPDDPTVPYDSAAEADSELAGLLRTYSGTEWAVVPWTSTAKHARGRFDTLRARRIRFAMKAIALISGQDSAVGDTAVGKNGPLGREPVLTSCDTSIVVVRDQRVVARHIGTTHIRATLDGISNDLEVQVDTAAKVEVMVNGQFPVNLDDTLVLPVESPPRRLTVTPIGSLGEQLSFAWHLDQSRLSGAVFSIQGDQVEGEAVGTDTLVIASGRWRRLIPVRVVATTVANH